MTARSQRMPRLAAWLLGSAALCLCAAKAPTCVPVAPVAPVCAAPSDCEGLPHVSCGGYWGCVGGACVWSCDPVGACADYASPVPAASVTPAVTVVPMAPISLHAEGSKSSCGAAVKALAWSVTQPEGSVARLWPSAFVASPSFQPNVVGAYAFCLHVWDSYGTKSAQPACVTVDVVPDQALHVELTWHTPNDTEESDSGFAVGSDLDLHLAHPFASGADLDCGGLPDPWFDGAFDCFWHNATPKWSLASAAEKSPKLVLADADGAGPEIATFASPSTLKTYRIGVHYWDDHGFGQAFARVRIFVYGVLTATVAEVPLNPLDMWSVGKIHFNDSSAANPAKVTICKQDKPPCQGGAAWLDEGDPCVTPCYVDKAFATKVGGKLGCL